MFTGNSLRIMALSVSVSQASSSNDPTANVLIAD